MASVLNGCNIGGGEVTLNIFPGWRSPWLSFYNTRRRVKYLQEEHKGVGGEEEEDLLFFEQEGQISVTGACSWWGDLPSEVTSP